MAENDIDPQETQEWIEALESVLENEGVERAHFLLERLIDKARRSGAHLPYSAKTAYVNTIPVHQEARSPGDRAIERRIRSFIRWNAMAMVVKANRSSSELGGHIASFASVATLFDMGFQHFFRGPGGATVLVALDHGGKESHLRIDFHGGRLHVFDLDGPASPVAMPYAPAGEGRFVTYRVPMNENQTVLDTVTWIQRHEDASLSGGVLRGAMVRCPLHGSRFDLRNGKPMEEPAEEPLTCYRVRVDGDDVLVELPG